LPLPSLAQFTGLEMGKLFRGDASILEDVLLLKSKELTLVEPYLKEAPFKAFCADVVMASVAPIIGHTEHLF